MAEIILVNKAKIVIEDKYFEDFQSCVNLPVGTILLVLHDNPLPENMQGVCISAPLASKGFASNFAKILLSFPKLNTWDCCIVIANKWCISREKYPAYFTYLLGHEFGHAHLYLSDISLHIYCCLIENYIMGASENAIQYPHELPNEQLFDQIGKYFSIKLHGDNKLEYEIDLLKEKTEYLEKQRLEMIQELTPRIGIDGLYKSIIDFSKPYKDKLIKYWEEDLKENKDDSLVSLVPDYKNFWDNDERFNSLFGKDGKIFSLTTFWEEG